MILIHLHNLLKTVVGVPLLASFLLLLNPATWAQPPDQHSCPIGGCLCNQKGPLDKCQGGCDSLSTGWGWGIESSYDPNDIIGPEGYNPGKWVSINDILPYMIRFENAEDFATAPAQKVSITHPIDEHINLFSFKLGSFGFAGMSFNIPPGRSSFSTRLDLRDSLGIYVDVLAGLDVTRRQAFWTFQTIDPATGLPPVDPFLGLLPVNDSITHRGEGFVNFTLEPISTAQTRDTAFAIASIVFDINEAIETPQIYNVIDAYPPTSQIDGLPATTTDPSFPLSWTAVDDPGGCGVREIVVYLSVDSGTYEVAYSSRGDSTVTFVGSPGHNYRFVSISTDNVGNTEFQKLQPDASITIEYLSLVDLGPDTTICPEDTLFLDAGAGFVSYLWSDASTDQILAVTDSGTYSVEVINTMGAGGVDTIKIGLYLAPSLDLGPDTAICSGGELTLDAGFGFTYSWSEGSTTQQVNVRTPGLYVVEITDANTCTNTDTIRIGEEPRPEASITRSNATDFCNTVNLTAHSSTTEQAYDWSTGETTRNIELNMEFHLAGEYYVFVTDDNGCRSADSAVFAYEPEDEFSSYTLLAEEQVNFEANSFVNHGAVGVSCDIPSLSGYYFSCYANFLDDADVTGTNAWVKAPLILDAAPPLTASKVYEVATVNLPSMEYHRYNSSYTPYVIGNNASVTVSDNKIDVTIGTGSDVTLTADTFGTITVDRFSNLTFTAGDIYIEELIYMGGLSGSLTTLQFEPDAKIHVKKGMQLGHYFVLNPDFHDITFYIGSVNPIGETVADSLVITGYGFEFNANVFAPGGYIDLNRTVAALPPPCPSETCPPPVEGPAIMRGKFIANKIHCYGNVVEWYGDLCDHAGGAKIASATVENEEEPIKEEQIDFQVFPNPNQGTFKLRYLIEDPLEPVQISIYNAHGQLVRHQVIHEPGLYLDQDIDLSDQATSGAYFIKLVNGVHLRTATLQVFLRN